MKLHDKGILADEMRLGRTVQRTIPILAYLRESRGVTGQHLIIVSKSVRHRKLDARARSLVPLDPRDQDDGQGGADGGVARLSS